MSRMTNIILKLIMVLSDFEFVKALFNRRLNYCLNYVKCHAFNVAGNICIRCGRSIKLVTSPISRHCQINAAKFGRTLIFALSSQNLTLIQKKEMKGGTLQINWHHTKPVLTLDFHPISGTLATGGADFDIKVLFFFSFFVQESEY